MGIRFSVPMMGIVALTGLFLLLVPAQQAVLAQEPSGVSAGSLNWTGIYVGGHAGGIHVDDQASLQLQVLPGFGIPTTPFNFDVGDDGFIGGVLGGINYQTGNIVFGMEADVGFADGVRTSGITGSFVSPGLPSAALDLTAHMRGRVGYAWERFLIFAAGGLVIADYETRGDTSTLVGYTVGSGIDFALTRNIVIRAEYLYDNYSKTTVSPGSTGFTGSAIILTPAYNADVETHTFRSVISFRFNSPIM